MRIRYCLSIKYSSLRDKDDLQGDVQHIQKYFYLELLISDSIYRPSFLKTPLSFGNWFDFHLQIIRGMTIKFANSPPCAWRGSSGQKPQYGLMMMSHQHFTVVLLLTYGSVFLSGVYHCLSVFRCFASGQCTCSQVTLCEGVFSYSWDGRFWPVDLRCVVVWR
jgi:hypothetical protein